MALKYVLLTLLDKQRYTGYEIVKSFDSSVGYFWSATHQQVYRELGKLTDHGLVKFASVKQGDKPDKKVYRITTSGRRELRDWLEHPLAEGQTKDLLLVKLTNINTDNLFLMLDEINRGIDRLTERYEIYKGIEKKHYSSAAQSGLPINDLGLYLSLRNGLINAEANLRWLKETRDIIAAQQSLLCLDGGSHT